MRASGLGKRFGGLQAVRDVSLDLQAGEIHAVIGPNGAGKSTLIGLLSGELRPTSGSIEMAGRPVTRITSEGRARIGLGRAYQKTTIFPRCTAFENARLAAQARSGRALAMWRDAAHADETHARAEAALTEAGLGERTGTVAGLLSHGEQRQLEIAMVLATDPTVVLLDEPFAGMGSAEAGRMIALVSRLRQGRAVLLVEHDMDAVFSLADRLTVMVDGAVVASGDPLSVRTDETVRAAYLGVEEMHA